MEDIDAVKRTKAGTLTYRLANANVFVSASGYHYIDHLDPVEDISPEISAAEPTDEEINYLEECLQSNRDRYRKQVKIVKRLVPIKDKAILDIGCGGGLFLSLMKAEGAKTVGIELNDKRAHYASKKYDLEIVKRPIEADYWQKNHANSYDVVTLWDVIEHVNFPLSTLRGSVRVLKDEGLLLIDTPCRDSFYHRMGELTYRLTGGHYPSFLNAMYSSHRFGHKQIFSTAEMRLLLEQAGLEVVEMSKFHELSFPYIFYLRKIFRSSLLAKLLLPLVHVFLFVFPVRNKMLAIGRKKAA